MHPTQITQWKRRLFESAPSPFGVRHVNADHVDVDELSENISKLEMERSPCYASGSTGLQPVESPHSTNRDRWFDVTCRHWGGDTA